MCSSDLSGEASVIETVPGVYSVLIGDRSFRVPLVAAAEGIQAWQAGARLVSVADARDRAVRSISAASAGPVSVRALMPGKVIKVLVTAGDAVQAGQGLIVVEAMKMQNEMKSPKDGVASKILTAEGATVAAGETLIVVD